MNAGLCIVSKVIGSARLAELSPRKCDPGLSNREQSNHGFDDSGEINV